MPQSGDAEQDFAGDGHSASTSDGAPPAPSLEKLVGIEELLSRLIDMSDVLCDLAVSAHEGNEVLPGSLYFLSETLSRDAKQLRRLCETDLPGE